MIFSDFMNMKKVTFFIYCVSVMYSATAFRADTISDNKQIAKMKIEIYRFYSDNFDITNFINGDSVSVYGELANEINDSTKVLQLKSALECLIQTNNFLGNLECFIPEVGVILRVNDSIEYTLAISLACKKAFCRSRQGFLGYLYFHNNSILETFLVSNNLLRFSNDDLDR